MAADSARRIIKNAAYRVYWRILDNTTFEPIAGGLTTPDAERSIDGAAFADCTNAETELGTTGTGYTELTVAEMSADHIWFTMNSADAAAIKFFKELIPEPALDSGVAQAGTASTLQLRAAASAVDDFYNGAILEIVRGTGAGQIRTVTDYVGSTTTATVDRDWATNPDNTSVYIIHPRLGQSLGADIVAEVNVEQIDGSAPAATALADLYKGGLEAGSVNDAAATTTSWIGDSGLSSTNDFYNNQLLIFTSGALAGQAEKVLDYVGATRTFTMANAFLSAPANGSKFVILGRVR